MRIRIFLLVLLSAAAIGARAIATDSLFAAVDMRDGLPESRVRCLLPLRDGRLAIAMAGTVSISDGCRFVNYKPDLASAYELKHFTSYRQLFCDSHHRLWLKGSNSLMAIDSRTGATVADLGGVFAAMGVADSVTNFFVDPLGRYWLFTAGGDMYLSADGTAARRFAGGLPVADDYIEDIAADSSRIFLCHRSGVVSGWDIAGSRRTLHSNPFSAFARRTLKKGATAALHGGRLWVLHNDLKERHGCFAVFDGRLRRWTTIEMPFKVSAYEFLSGDTMIVAGKRHAAYYIYGGDSLRFIGEVPGSRGFGEVSEIVADRYGGLWVGTSDKGIFYRNDRRRHLVTTLASQPRIRRYKVFDTQRAEELAGRHAKNATNCSLTGSGMLAWLGTRNGLLVFDSADRLVAAITSRDGLANDNVQAIMAGDGGEVWVSTTNGISRVRPLGRDTFGIVTYGRLDGLELGGREFLPGQMVRDSAGLVRVGFSGGECVFNPRLMDVPRYEQRCPDPAGVPEEEAGAPLAAVLAAVVAAALAAGGALVAARRWRRPGGTPAPAAAPAAAVEEAPMVIETADRMFLNKLRETVERNICNTELNVQMLSKLMAMDRTVLYRRMQALTGVAPSVYIRTLKMNMAARLLSEGNFSVNEVALRVGFADAKYFSKSFKEAFGVSPNQYKNGGRRRQGQDPSAAAQA